MDDGDSCTSVKANNDNGPTVIINVRDNCGLSNMRSVRRRARSLVYVSCVGNKEQADETVCLIRLLWPCPARARAKNQEELRGGFMRFL